MALYTIPAVQYELTKSLLEDTPDMDLPHTPDCIMGIMLDHNENAIELYNEMGNILFNKRWLYLTQSILNRYLINDSGPDRFKNLTTEFFPLFIRSGECRYIIKKDMMNLIKDKISSYINLPSLDDIKEDHEDTHYILATGDCFKSMLLIYNTISCKLARSYLDSIEKGFKIIIEYNSAITNWMMQRKTNETIQALKGKLDEVLKEKHEEVPEERTRIVNTLIPYAKYTEGFFHIIKTHDPELIYEFGVSTKEYNSDVLVKEWKVNDIYTADRIIFDLCKDIRVCKKHKYFYICSGLLYQIDSIIILLNDMISNDRVDEIRYQFIHDDELYMHCRNPDIIL